MPNITKMPSTCEKQMWFTEDPEEIGWENQGDVKDTFFFSVRQRERDRDGEKG